MVEIVLLNPTFRTNTVQKNRNIDMKWVHWWINVLIIGIFFFVWVGVALVATLNPTNAMLWHTLMVVVLLAVLYNTFYQLQSDTMIIRVYIQNIFSVASSYPQSGYEGLWGSGFVPVFPPGLAHAYTLPLTLLTIPFPRIEAITDEDRSDPANPIPSLPVLISLYISFRLNPELAAQKQFMRVIPIIEPFSKDFTVEHEVEFFDRTDPVTGKIEYVPKLCPCITSILVDKLNPAVGEAASRGVGSLTLPAIIHDRFDLEQAIKQQFDNTVLTESGIMVVKRSKKMVKRDGKMVEMEVVELERGPAATFLDFNIDAVTVANPDALKAMSAEQIALFLAKAKMAQAAGDAEYIKQVSQQAGTSAGRAALAAEALRNLPPGTKLFAGTNLLSATAASLLDQEPPKT